jgi:hypothetical protein
MSEGRQLAEAKQVAEADEVKEMREAGEAMRAGEAKQMREALLGPSPQKIAEFFDAPFRTLAFYFALSRALSRALS